jgi:hypothetical protein
MASNKPTVVRVWGAKKQDHPGIKDEILGYAPGAQVEFASGTADLNPRSPRSANVRLVYVSSDASTRLLLREAYNYGRSTTTPLFLVAARGQELDKVDREQLAALDALPNTTVAWVDGPLPTAAPFADQIQEIHGWRQNHALPDTDARIAYPMATEPPFKTISGQNL